LARRRKSALRLEAKRLPDPYRVVSPSVDDLVPPVFVWSSRGCAAPLPHWPEFTQVQLSGVDAARFRPLVLQGRRPFTAAPRAFPCVGKTVGSLVHQLQHPFVAGSGSPLIPGRHPTMLGMVDDPCG
jgi:hypothetical protein